MSDISNIQANIPLGVLTNSLSQGGELIIAEIVEMLGYKDSVEETRLNYKYAKKVLNNHRNDTEIEKKIAISPYSPWYFETSFFKDWLKTFSQKHGISVHIPQTPALSPLLKEMNYRHILIMRDPRILLIDIIFTGQMPLHFLNADFDSLSLPQRLKFIMEGGYASKAGANVKSFSEVYRSMLDWQNDPECLLVCYEELSGDLGSKKQQKAVINIATYLNMPFNHDILKKLNRPDSSWATRLKINQVDEWNTLIDSESFKYIIEYCQSLCGEAGYE